MDFKELTSRSVNPRLKRSGSLRDVVGVELFSGDARGCPAVRLQMHKGVWAVHAVGFVPPPKGELPKSWKDLDRQEVWSLPSPFNAPVAALAVNSADALVRQTTLEALSEGGEPPKDDVPVSRNGSRIAASAMGEANFMLEASIPEYQALWLARLLPEGRRPTSASVQVGVTAMLGALAGQPAFVAANGNAVVIFVTRTAVYLAGFREGALILFRECPGVGGYMAVREAVKKSLGFDESMVDEVLGDSLIDPGPALEPIVSSVLQQLRLSLDYLTSRMGAETPQVLLCGLNAGARHWVQLARERSHIELTAVNPFDGLKLPAKAGMMPSDLKSPDGLQVFLTALGAARSAMEVAS